MGDVTPRLEKSVDRDAFFQMLGIVPAVEIGLVLGSNVHRGQQHALSGERHVENPMLASDTLSGARSCGEKCDSILRSNVDKGHWSIRVQISNPWRCTQRCHLEDKTGNAGRHSMSCRQLSSLAVHPIEGPV